MKYKKFFNKRNYLKLRNKEIYNHEEDKTDNNNINDIYDINIYYNYQKIIFILILCIFNFIIFNYKYIKKNPPMIKFEVSKESEKKKKQKYQKKKRMKYILINTMLVNIKK